MKITRLFSLLLFAFQFFAIYLVSSGFFFVNEQVSSTSKKNPVDGSDLWFKPKAKALFFIIDALRFDFLHYNETLVGQEKYPYQNRFAKLHNIFKANPENSLFFKVYADPPTVTVHRVQSMLTGNLPPFFEITENFGSSAISEDNIIKKMISNNRNVSMVGDYIWKDLFPSEFNTSFPVRSFDIHDFDSVDNEIQKRVFSMIEKNDSDFLIAHALGVDHVGHTHGIFHEKMGEKLSEMDDLAVKIISAIDDNTVLFIMGDHGMTNEGDHGGGSKEETEIAIAAYCKKGFRKYSSKSNIDEIMKSMNEKPDDKILKQVDIAPTLSMLLGLPIPYSNIGQIISDFYINVNEESDSEYLRKIMRDNYLNVKQTFDYLLAVQSKFKKFSEATFDGFQKNFTEIKKEVRRGKRVVETIRKMQEFSDDVYELVKRSNSYDMFLMLAGIGLSACLIFLPLAVIQYLNQIMRNDKVFYQWNNEISLGEVWRMLWMILKTSRFLQISAVASILLGFSFKLSMLKSLSIFTLLLVLWLYGTLFKKAGHQIKDLKKANTTALKWSQISFLLESPTSTLLAISIVAVQIALRLSVVFTRTERDLLQSIITLILLLIFVKLMVISANTFKSSSKTKVIASILAVSIIIYFLPYSDPSIYPEESSVNHELPSYYESKPVKLIAPLIPLFVFIQQIFKQISSQHTAQAQQGEKKRRMILSFLHILSLIFISFYHIAASYKEDYQKDFTIQILIPRIIYVLAGLNFAVNYFMKSELGEVQKDLSDAQICLVQILFLLVGPNAVTSFVLLFLAFQLLNYYFIHTKAESVSYPFMIALVSFYGYFCTGHTNQVTNVRVSQGFVGLEEFNFFISGGLVLINTMSSFILGMIFICAFIRQIKGEVKGRRGDLFGDVFSVKTWMLYIVFFTAGFASTSINCSFNLDSLLLVYDFAPKYFIDSSIYIFVLISTLLFTTA